MREKTYSHHWHVNKLITRSNILVEELRIHKDMLQWLMRQEDCVYNSNLRLMVTKKINDIEHTLDKYQQRIEAMRR